MLDVVGYWQDSFTAVQRLADDAREERGRGQVRFTRPDADRGQPNPDTVHEPAPGVVREQQLGDRLLRAVARQGGRAVVVADRLRIRGAEDGDRRGEDEPGPVPGPREADGVEQQPRPVQVGAVTLLKIGLCLAGDDGGQMEDDVGQAGEQLSGDAALGEIGNGALDLEARSGRCCGRDDIGQQGV